jgi:hypothetical protein
MLPQQRILEVRSPFPPRSKEKTKIKNKENREEDQNMQKMQIGVIPPRPGRDLTHTFAAISISGRAIDREINSSSTS